MKYKLYFLFLPLAIVIFSTLNTVSAQVLPADTTPGDYARERAKRVQENAEHVKTKAMEVRSEYHGYKVRAHGCKGAFDEASDGYKLAEEAVKACDEAIKYAKKASSSKGIKQMMRLIRQADKKIAHARYQIQQAEDRRKEVLFELKGC